MTTSSTKPCLIIHGGAGNITRENLSPEAYAIYATNLRRIYRSTSQLLAKGATALDAATHAVTLFEDCPLFNCGKGAVSDRFSQPHKFKGCGLMVREQVFTRDGTIELEASVGNHCLESKNSVANKCDNM